MKYFVTLTEEEWTAAIGDRDRGGLDTCELQRCCGNISDIRDALIACREHGGMTEPEREAFQELLNNHEPVLKNRANLAAIFRQLNVKWW